MLTDAQRIEQLKALCAQAERLRKEADKLCKTLTQQIESTRASHRTVQPTPGKRKRP